MIQSVIVEDEAIAARKLIKLLERCQVEVRTVCKSNAELAAYLANNPEPELFFMDIHLNDGIIFNFLSNNNVQAPIIFTTAYDAYAIKAFKQNSIDYLLKPIDYEELQQAISKFSSLQNKNIDTQLLSQIILQAQTQEKSYRERLKIKIGDRIKSIPIQDIAFFYSKDKINFVYTTAHRSYPIDYSLDSIFAELDPKVFYKVNRGYVISISHIQDMISYSNSRLKIIMDTKDDHEIIVARERTSAFKDWLG